MMWWLVVFAGLYCFRAKIAQIVGRFIPDMPPNKMSVYGHGITLAAALVYIVPLQFVGLAIVKRPSYLLSMWSTVLTCILVIKANNGPPPMPQEMSFSCLKQHMVTMQPWLQQAAASVDFQFLFFSLIFLTAQPSIWVLFILGRRSLWAVCKFCAKSPPDSMLWRSFAPYWAKLQAQEAQVLLYSALAEVALGIWLTVALLLPGHRQILTCFLYWNYLKMRYQVPRSHEQHLKAWKMLEQRVRPVLQAVPILEKPIDMAKGWFAPQYAYRPQ